MPRTINPQEFFAAESSGRVTGKYNFEDEFIPGILQTRGYADCVLLPGDDHEEKLEYRLQRLQRALGTIASMNFVMTEAALANQPGTAEVTAAANRHLISLMTYNESRLRIRVLPDGVALGDHGSYVIHEYSEAADTNADIYVDDGCTILAPDDSDTIQMILESNRRYMDITSRDETFDLIQVRIDRLT